MITLDMYKITDQKSRRVIDTILGLYEDDALRRFLKGQPENHKMKMWQCLRGRPYIENGDRRYIAVKKMGVKGEKQ